MSDIVERLGWHHECPATGNLVLRNPDGPEAAAEITRLRAELARVTALGKGLEKPCRDILAVGPDHDTICAIGPIYNCNCDVHPARTALRQAHAAWQGRGDGE
jgi:hypothetical protein